MHNRFRDCPELADIIRSRYAYRHANIDPKQNPDNLQPEQDHSSPRQPSSRHVTRPVVKSCRGYGQ